MGKMFSDIDYFCCLLKIPKTVHNETKKSSETYSKNINASVVTLEQICNSTAELNCHDIIKHVLQPHIQSLGIVLIVALFVLFIIGSTGNICVILCVTLFRKMRTVSHVFLLNLACSDLLVFLICEPFTIVSLINPDWIFGSTLCRLNGALQGTFVSVSILTLTSVCIERYIVIVVERFNYARFNFRYLFAWVAGIWIISFLITTPLLQAYEVKEMNLKFLKPTNHCLETWSGLKNRKQVFTTLIFILLYLLPLVFMMILYSKVAIHLKRSTSIMLNIKNKDRKGIVTKSTPPTRFASKLILVKDINHSRQRISKLLMILTLLFAIFWMPYHILNLFIDYLYGNVQQGNQYFERILPTEWINSYLYPIAQILAYINNAINPLCTLIISKKFRTALNQMRKCHYSVSTK